MVKDQKRVLSNFFVDLIKLIFNLIKFLFISNLKSWKKILEFVDLAYFLVHLESNDKYLKGAWIFQ